MSHCELSKYVPLDVGSSASKLPAFVKCVGNSFLYLLNGTVFTSAPGSTFTRSGLLPCLVIICKVVWNDVWPSDATSMGNLS